MITNQKWEKKIGNHTKTIRYSREEYPEGPTHYVTTEYAGIYTERNFKTRNAAMNYVRKILR